MFTFRLLEFQIISNFLLCGAKIHHGGGVDYEEEPCPDVKELGLYVLCWFMFYFVLVYVLFCAVPSSHDAGEAPLWSSRPFFLHFPHFFRKKTSRATLANNKSTGSKSLNSPCCRSW